ncbi:MAG: flavodoxin family protein [Pseudomonadota bacterium]
MRALTLNSSPRSTGNSATLARAVGQGLAAAGHHVETVQVGDVLTGFLRDCRTCRDRHGNCTIDDDYGGVFLDKMLSADGIIFATPVYWYGMSAHLKAAFDRMFCYVAGSYPGADDVVARLQGKRIGLVLSSEETFPTVTAAIAQQIQEYCRYTRSDFVGTVHGIGNARGEVRRDPRNPTQTAHVFGARFFDALATDYRIDTPRSGRVWGAEASSMQDNRPIDCYG